MKLHIKFWLVSLIVLISNSSSAYDFEVDGIYYNITSQSNLEVGVTYNDEKLSYYSNKSYEGKITIPEYVNFNNRTYTVTSIQEEAFGVGTTGLSNSFIGCRVSEVTLPNTIQLIDNYAFCCCNELKNINLPPELFQIGIYAFANTGIEKIIIPDIVTEIGRYCFTKSNMLKQVVLGKSLSKIGMSAFERCTSLLEVFFTSIGKPEEEIAVFYECNKNLEKYVPSNKNYGFGKDYVSFDNNSFEYSGGAHNVNWTNNIKYLNCNIPTIQTEVNVGEYTKYVTATYSGDVNLTVEIPYQYEITPAPLTVTVNDQEREYGLPNPTFTSNVSGFVPGEGLTALGISPTYQCEAMQTSNVGNYPIRAILEASNYDITYNYGNLTINKAPLSLTVMNSERQYGDVNSTFELSYSGLRNDETTPAWNAKPQFQTNATQTSSVGNYEVTVSGGEAVNYNITQYNPGTLSILKRELIAKAKDEVRLYGEENPEFTVSYSGFANGENSSVFQESPIAHCSANSESNAGNYPIEVTGGLAENYNFIYENGTLTIDPITIGWEKEYNSVTYNDMAKSTSDLYFNYIPRIKGDYSEDDFWIDLWFLDKDNKYGEQQNSITISGGEYAGTYIYTNVDRPIWAGKYIFELKSKGTNPNVVANPVRAYLTVNTASTNFKWDASSVIEVEEGQTIDLGISYEADMWCTFNTNFDSELISVSYENAQSNTPTWYVTGLKQGETTLYFSIECRKNDQGFYDFKDSSVLSKKIKVVEGAGVENIYDDNALISIYSMNGILIKKDCKSEDLKSLSKGIYIIKSGNKSYKIVL